MDHDPDQHVMDRIQAGDEGAFEALVRKYEGLVFALARRYLGSRYPDIEDVAQQVFLRIWRGRMGFRPEARVKTWLYSITVNACLNEIRRLRTAKHRSVRAFTAVFGDGEDGGGFEAPDPAPPRAAGGLEYDEVRRRVEAAVDRLPSQQRLAMVLTRFHGESYQDVAEVLNTTVSAVKSLLTRARAGLRESLADLLEVMPGIAETRTRSG